MKVLLSGLCGHMGKEVQFLCEKGYQGADLVAGVDYYKEDNTAVPCAASFDEAETEVDVVVDFSHHSCTQALLNFCVRNHLPVVMATTGLTEEEQALIAEAAKEIPVFFSANYSIGIALLIELAKKTAQVMDGAQIEIVETHHVRKLDAPSGTALAIAKGLQEVRPEATLHCGRSGQGKRAPEEIGIQSVRIGNVVGIHEVLVGTDNQTITLKHEAHSRALFAEGALTAAAFVQDKAPGLYGMNDMIRF